MRIAPQDRHRYRQCAHEGCNELVLPPRRKCNRCRKTTYKVTTLPPSNKGRRARNISLTRPDKVRTKRAKRQHPEQLASSPELRMSNWRFM